MDATSSADLVHTQVHPRRPWRTQGPRPSVRGSKGRRRKKRQLLQAPNIRPQPGHPDQPGHPARPSEIRRPSQKTPEAEPSQPGHPAPRPVHLARREPPDIRPSSRKSGAPSQKLDPASPDIRPQRPDIRRLGKARTSGPLCLRAAHLGRGPCTPSSLRLYILLLHHFIVSIGLAHMRDRALLIHIGSTPRERPQPLYGDDPPWIQDLLTEKTPIKTSSRRRTGYRLYRPLLTLDLVYYLCVHRSSACVIYSCWLSDFSRVSLVFPLVFIAFFIGILSKHERSSSRVLPYIILVSKPR